jgi:hypothetical protein
MHVVFAIWLLLLLLMLLQMLLMLLLMLLQLQLLLLLLMLMLVLVMLLLLLLLLLMMMMMMMILLLLLRQLHVQLKHCVGCRPPQPESDAGQRELVAHRCCIQRGRRLPVHTLQHVAGLGVEVQGETSGTRRFRWCLPASRRRCAARQWSGRCRGPSLLQ